MHQKEFFFAWEKNVEQEVHKKKYVRTSYVEHFFCKFMLI